MIHKKEESHVYLPLEIEAIHFEDGSMNINFYNTAKMKDITDISNREFLSLVHLNMKNPIISQKGLAVIPIADPELNIRQPHFYNMPVQNIDKFNILPKNIKYPFNLYDVKFPYEITLNAIDSITKEPKPLVLRGPGVAPVYFALIYAQKGLLPSDCVPGGTKTAPAGFSRTIINNEDELYNVMGRFVHYALGGNEKEKFMEFTPVKDEEKITHGYTLNLNEERCKALNCPRYEPNKGNTAPTEEYKQFVDNFLTKAAVSRVFETEGDSKEILFNLYKYVWRPNKTDEENKQDPMYKAMLDNTPSINV